MALVIALFIPISFLMMTFNPRKLRVTFLSAVVASLILHFVLGLEIILFNPPVHQEEKIELQIVETPPQQDEKKSSQDENLAKQVVEQDEKQMNDEIDAKAKFLSAHNQKVQKQTVTKNHGEFRNRPDQMTAPNARPMAAQPSPKIDLRNFMPKLDIAKAVEDRAKKEQEYDRDAELITQKKLETKQTQAQQAVNKPGQAGGLASQTLDYIKDLDPGLETLLSTREFVFYTYYSRIRKQLNQFWGPKVREKLVVMYKQGRQIASTEDKITKCLITLDKTGNLARVQIIGNSGVRELDEAAVDAFKLAAPFPNPPKGIQESDGSIKIRWDFVLEI